MLQKYSFGGCRRCANAWVPARTIWSRGRLRVRCPAHAMTAISDASNPKRIGAPILDRLLDVAGFGERACQHRAHQCFQFVISGKTERDDLSRRQLADLVHEHGGQSFLITKPLFESN